MQVQKVNNQQPNFGSVLKLEVRNPDILEKLKRDARDWQGDKHAPLNFHFKEPYVTLFTGDEKILVRKARENEARLTKQTFSDFTAEAFTKAYNALMNAQKAKTELIEGLEYGVEPKVIK